MALLLYFEKGEKLWKSETKTERERAKDCGNEDIIKRSNSYEITSEAKGVRTYVRHEDKRQTEGEI